MHQKKEIVNGTNIASLDIGSHTARMLIGQYNGAKEFFKTLARERAYIRIAEDLGGQGETDINDEAIKRTTKVLIDFSIIAKQYGVERISAVATGVVRRAGNRERFIKIIEEKTGIRVEIISGEREAMLTRLGALHFLDIHKNESLIFDLGGGTTEFIPGNNDKELIRSLPLGAMVLTQSFFSSDPPAAEDVSSLAVYIAEILKNGFSRTGLFRNNLLLVGTGGTVTTLCAMIRGLSAEDITHEKLNGIILKRMDIESLIDKISVMPYDKRLKLKGLDSGRAGIILAGSIAVLGILNYFEAEEMIVSYSDILEGIILEIIKGAIT